MRNTKKYDYGKAEADLYEIGLKHPEDVYGFQSEKGFRSFLAENGLNPDRYSKSDSKKETSSSSSNSSTCYLTTACTVAKGLPDDCLELQTLRSFRDTYLAALPNGQTEIEQYYRIAPGIVSAIDQKDDRSEIWNQIYSELITPCVRMIQAQENHDAYQLYKAYSLELCKKYCN